MRISNLDYINENKLFKIDRVLNYFIFNWDFLHWVELLLKHLEI